MLLGLFEDVVYRLKDLVLAMVGKFVEVVGGLGVHSRDFGEFLVQFSLQIDEFVIGYCF